MAVILTQEERDAYATLALNQLIEEHPECLVDGEWLDEGWLFRRIRQISLGVARRRRNLKRYANPSYRARGVRA